MGLKLLLKLIVVTNVSISFYVTQDLEGLLFVNIDQLVDQSELLGNIPYPEINLGFQKHVLDVSALDHFEQNKTNVFLVLKMRQSSFQLDDHLFLNLHQELFEVGILIGLDHQPDQF